MQRQIVLFDSEEFYGLTLDIVLFNLGQESAFKVQNRADYERFKKGLEKSQFNNGIYIFDEYFGQGKVDLPKLAEEIKTKDDKATIISYSVSQPDEIDNKEIYDKFVIKSGKEIDRSLIKTLSELLGVEFIADNNDPEREKLTTK